MKNIILTILTFTLALNTIATEETYQMQLKAPIKTWDEAIPLGNGIMGGLLWGEGNTINLSLDRGDLWDERQPKVFSEKPWGFQDIVKLVKEKNQKEINRKYDNPYREVAPTKLPGGRLVLTLDKTQTAETFSLDMHKAEGNVEFEKAKLSCFFSAEKEVALIKIKGSSVEYKFLRPKGLDRLGYKPAEFGESEGMSWMVQDGALGLKYAVVVASVTKGNTTQLAVSISANTKGDDPLKTGKARVRKALHSGYDTMLEPHLKWWDQFWNISNVEIPNTAIQKHYNLVKYFYGAASRADAPPIPLQGVWTQDNGKLPPWKGDFHNDLNTQMTYLAYHTAGLTDCGMSFINMNWNLLPTYRKFAKNFFGVKGASMASVATLSGKPTGGWVQYSFTAPNALWVGQTFYLHWRHTMDRTFLAECAYPWLSEITTGIVNLLEEKDGKLYLPLSSSPEIFNNSLQAWLPPNSNYDLALMQWAFDALTVMADALDKKDDAKKWRELSAKLEPLHSDDKNVLMFDRVHKFNQSHRHHSHAMAIHPLGILNIDGSEEDRKIINATLDKIIEKGTQQWTGYSFSWFACMLARTGRAEEALKDQINAGLSHFKYRPFTLEGNFLAMEAVHEMLLQSWPVSIANDPAPVIRIFPAMPESWTVASFSDLSAEGGFRVSAKRENGFTTSFKIKATHGGLLKLKDNFGKSEIKFSSTEIKKADGYYLLNMKSGEVLTASLKR